tara:strand:- start:134 stop:616 length:483 start_codon:yes stop_codon:yes gene_type:complete
MSKLTHLDTAGNAQMVDISAKDTTTRIARAEALVEMLPNTLALIASGDHSKGDVLAVARIAGIQAAKRCSDMIPLCHPLMLSKVTVDLELEADFNRVRITSMCKVNGRTGVEMEALCAASTAALTIYDMCKAVDRGMTISGLRVLEKMGGKSGHWQVEPS